MTKTHGTKAELIEEIQTRGAWVAYQASLEVAQDQKAAANARAQAASNILRGGGFFASRTDETGLKEPHEMSAEELKRSLAEITRSLASEGVFD